MKYISDNLNDFEFHDAVLEFVSFKENTLIVTAKALNIHKDTKQNTNDYDAEIKSALITFEKFGVTSLEFLRAYKTNSKGKLYTNDPQIIYYNKIAKDVLIKELKSSISLNGLNVLNILTENRKTVIELETNFNSVFTAICSYSNVKIEWDEYCGRAWYEHYRNYQYNVTLVTKFRKQKNIVRILQILDDDGNTTEVRASMHYNNKDYFGVGTDYFWIDAIADLQKQLPNNVILKCCIACKHGSLCPVGDNLNEVFCVKDICPKQKSDLFFYTEDENERTKRSREYFSQCENFKPQKKIYFTYNDFYYYLKK